MTNFTFGGGQLRERETIEVTRSEVVALRRAVKNELSRLFLTKRRALNYGNMDDVIEAEDRVDILMETKRKLYAVFGGD